MTAVIYARYSSDSQREASIEGQLRDCKDCWIPCFNAIIHIHKIIRIRIMEIPQVITCQANRKCINIHLFRCVSQFSHFNLLADC